MSPLSTFKILSPACVFPMCRLSGDGRSVVLRRLNRIKWMFGTISVVVSSYMAPLSLDMLPLNIFELVIFGYGELNSLFWIEGNYCICWIYAKPLTFDPNLLSLDSRELAVYILP